MKINLKKHKQSGAVLGVIVVGGSLFATMTALAIGTTAMFIYLGAWLVASPVLYLMHKARGGGKFFTFTHITYPSKPFPPVESPAPILSASELEHNATRHRK